MGQLRINTIARLLDAPRGETAPIWDEYAKKKLEKLFVKYEGLDPRVIIQLAGIAQDHLELQYAKARSLRAPEYSPDVFYQSPAGVAQISEELAEIDHCERSFKAARTDLDRVDIFRDLLIFLTKPCEAVVRKAAARTLNKLYDGTPFSLRSELVTRPLAAAVALNLPPSITRQIEKRAVESFVGFRFHGSLEGLGRAITSQFNFLNRRETGALLAAYRIAEQEERCSL